jgi:hypothetical protein
LAGAVTRPGQRAAAAAGSSSSTARPASRQVRISRSNSRTRASASAILRLPTSRQAGRGSGPSCNARKVATESIASLTRSIELRTCPTSPAACAVVTLASAGSFSISRTSRWPASVSR